MKGNLLFVALYVSPINSSVYNSVKVNERNLLLGTVYVSPINSCVYNSVNERESTIVDGICLPYNLLCL